MKNFHVFSNVFETQKFIIKVAGPIKGDSVKGEINVWYNSINGKQYVGSTTNLKERLANYYETNFLNSCF